jgi:outer membrane lipoprotein SlyB
MVFQALRRRSRPIAGCVVVIMVAMTGLAGCESTSQTVREHKETAVGAGVGAAGGAVVGGLAGGTKGAIIGGLLGALAGGVVGNYLERQDRDRTAAATAVGYQPDQGNLIRVENVQASPTTAKPGSTVNLTSTYTVLTPTNQPISIRETREVRHDGALVADPAIDVQRNNGTFTSTLPITLPSNARTGTYEVTTTVVMGDRSSRSMTTFTVQ